MITILRQFAILYSAITLFVMELLYQTILAIGRGTRYSLVTLKNAFIDSLFEIISDLLMLIVDFFQSLIDGLSIGWHKARDTANDFKRSAAS